LLKEAGGCGPQSQWRQSVATTKPFVLVATDHGASGYSRCRFTWCSCIYTHSTMPHPVMFMYRFSRRACLMRRYQPAWPGHEQADP